MIKKLTLAIAMLLTLTQAACTAQVPDKCQIGDHGKAQIGKKQTLKANTPQPNETNPATIKSGVHKHINAISNEEARKKIVLLEQDLAKSMKKQKELEEANKLFERKARKYARQLESCIQQKSVQADNLREIRKQLIGTKIAKKNDEEIHKAYQVALTSVSIFILTIGLISIALPKH